MVGNYKTLEDFQSEIVRQEAVKNDYVVPAKKMFMESDRKLGFRDSVGDRVEAFEMQDIAHEQLATKLGIPMNYYRKMTAVEGLRTTNVNSWLYNSGESHMIRTLDGKARAVLSDRLKPIDNILILSAFAPVVSSFPGVQFKSTALTPTRMYLQAVFPSLSAEIVPGDVVQAGVTLTNSEVGKGAVDIASTVWRLVCSNGLIGESILSRRHVGRRIGENEEDYNLFKSDTIRAELRAFQLKIRDCLAAALTEASWGKSVDKMKQAAGIEIEKPELVIRNVTERFDQIFNEGDLEKIMRNMVKARDFTKWGLVNGVTALAQITDDRDKQFEYEKAGNMILDLGWREWEELSA